MFFWEELFYINLNKKVAIPKSQFFQYIDLVCLLNEVPFGKQHDIDKSVMNTRIVQWNKSKTYYCNFIRDSNNIKDDNQGQ